MYIILNFIPTFVLNYIHIRISFYNIIIGIGTYILVIRPFDKI